MGLWGGRSSARVGIALVTLIAGSGARGWPEEARRGRFWIAVDNRWAVTLLGALEGAHRRLARPGCQEIFSEFNDGSGRPLRENLAALGRTGQEYLGWVLFADGSNHSRCRDPQTLAFTVPGNRVVFVCAPRFADWRMNNRRETEIVVLHELLHSLGLGEDPPSASEISATVRSRCG